LLLLEFAEAKEARNEKTARCLVGLVVCSFMEKFMTSFIARLKQEEVKAGAIEESIDPWKYALQRVRGKVDFFGSLEAHQLPNPVRSAGGPNADRRNVSTAIESYD
jgi:hypothetical protein